MNSITISKPMRRGIFGLIASFLILALQLNRVGRSVVSELRRSSLLFTQAILDLSIVSNPRIWLESKSRLEKKILEYELKIRELEAAASRLSALEKENFDLKASSVSSREGEWVGSTLLSGGSTYLVDVGSGSGVESGDLVVARGGLLGTVNKVEENLSQLVTIFDPEARFAVRVGADGTVGILRNKRGKLILTTISRTEVVKVGDTVSSLGDEQVRKSGLLIGTVEQILTRPADPVSTFVVKPTIDIFQLRAVVILKEF